MWPRTRDADENDWVSILRDCNAAQICRNRRGHCRCIPQHCVNRNHRPENPGSQTVSIELVEDENMAMKSESVTEHPSRDPLTRSSLSWPISLSWWKPKLPKSWSSTWPRYTIRSNPEFVETVADTFEDAIQTSYSDSNEGLKSAMVHIVEHALKNIIRAGQGYVFDEIQLGHLMQSESIVEQMVKCVLSSPMFIVPLVDIAWNLVDKSIDNQHPKNRSRTSTLTVFTELSHERASSNHCILSKLSSGNKSWDHRKEGRRRHRISRRWRGEK